MGPGRLIRWLALSMAGVLFFASFSIAVPLTDPEEPGEPGEMDSSGRGVLKKGTVTVLYDPPLRQAAREVLKLYPSIRRNLESKIGWPADFEHEVLLVKDTVSFRLAAGTSLVVALARPHESLVIVDYTRAGRRPFDLRETLAHELCHLVLHRHIFGPGRMTRRERLPRWLDEGLCQWASGGIGELEALGRSSEIERAVITRRLMPLSWLEEDFPPQGGDLILAYEESRSVTDYIEASYGERGIRDILGALRDGEHIEEAVYLALGVSLDELEANWLSNLRQRHSFFSWFGNNIYTIIFALGALAALAAFIRVLWKIHMHRDEDDGPL